MITTTTVRFRVKVHMMRGSDGWVFKCKDYDFYATGKTQAEARENFYRGMCEFINGKLTANCECTCGKTKG